MAQATREAYGQALAELVQKNPKVVVLDADLAGSTKSGDAKKVAPERFFDMGIAEADMIGTAAGLAASGYIPFASSFSMFSAGRAWEQIRNSVAYPHLNVKVVGTHSGISVGEDGVSHQAIEDIALMRAIPGMEVYVPCDGAETKAVIAYVAGTKNPCYIRLGRSKVQDIYPADAAIDVTKAAVLNHGEKTAIFACGLMVQAAMDACRTLQAEGINPTVVDVCRLKQADEETIGRVLHDHAHIITCEEHNVIGGLGSLISEISVRTTPRLITKIGMQDRFAESGEAKALLKKYGMDAEAICQAVREQH